MALNKQSPGEKAFQLSNNLFMLLLCVVCLYPLWYVLMASFSDPVTMFGKRGLMLWPIAPYNFKGYWLVITNPLILSGFKNTIIFILLGTTLNMFITIMAAYGLSRKGYFFNGLIMKVIAFTMYFAGGLIPFYLLVKNLRMLDSYAAIILPVAMNTWNLIIMRTSFMAIPDSLEESARLDGANDWTILWRIIVPLAQATIAVILLFYAVDWWNTWFNASIFLSTKTKFPLQLVLREILIQNAAGGASSTGGGMVASAGVGQTAQESYRLLIKYCTIIVATTPILVAYPFLQRYFVKGVMIGSIKG